MSEQTRLQMLETFDMYKTFERGLLTSLLNRLKVKERISVDNYTRTRKELSLLLEDPNIENARIEWELKFIAVDSKLDKQIVELDLEIHREYITLTTHTTYDKHRLTLYKDSFGADFLLVLFNNYFRNAITIDTVQAE